MTPGYPRRAARLMLVLLALAACTDATRSGPVPRRTEPLPRRTESSIRNVRWRTLPSTPTARTEVTASASESHLYVAGGFGANGETVPTLEVFDVDRRTWQPGPPLPIPVNHAMSAFLDRLYVVGGYLGPGLGNPTDRAFVLEGSRWSELPRMPEPRAAAGAASVNGKLYVAGGVGAEGLAHQMLVFDPSTMTWSREDGPPTPREHLGVAATGGRLFVVGGRTGGIGSNLSAVEAYDPGTGMWEELPDMPTARGGIAAAATTNGFVVAPGGEADATFEEAEAFDIRAGGWAFRYHRCRRLGTASASLRSERPSTSWRVARRPACRYRMPTRPSTWRSSGLPYSSDPGYGRSDSPPVSAPLSSVG